MFIALCISLGFNVVLAAVLFWLLATGRIGIGKVDDPFEFVRRPIEPDRDGQTVTRDPDAPRKHARVSTAHVSQQRRAWKSNS